MTIAIRARVYAGVVLAADSAGTLSGRNGSPEKIYYNSSKVFELREGLPIGAVTWGLGSFGPLSIAAMISPIGALLAPGAQYAVDPNNYTVEEVADSVRDFLEHNYGVAHRRSRRKRPGFYLLIAGYSSGQYESDEWLIEIDETGRCLDLRRPRERNDYGVISFAENWATDLLVNGYSEYLLTPVAQRVRIAKGKVEALVVAFEQISRRINPVRPEMPIRDAIELVSFLANVECGYSRFIPNQPAPTVGGPIEVLAITPTDGLRWIHRTNHFRSLGG